MLTMARTHGISAYAGGCRCDVCRDAWNAYQRPRNAARYRAMRRLTRMFPREFRELLDEELDRT